MKRYIVIKSQDGIHQYDSDYNPITTWSDKYCDFNKNAYRTIIKYNNEVIFDGKLE